MILKYCNEDRIKIILVKFLPRMHEKKLKISGFVAKKIEINFY